MKIARSFSSVPRPIIVALLLGLAACNNDDDSTPLPAPSVTQTAQPTSTRTAAPTTTNTPEPTATATAPPHEHDEIVFGSTAAGGGAVQVVFDDADHLHLAFDTCLGGSGEDCVGGLAIFSSDSPGYEHTLVDEPESSLFLLDDGTTVSVEVFAIDDGLSLRKDGATADAAGETLVLGTIPALDHTHVDYVAAIPGGTVGWEKSVTLRLLATGYTPSDEITLTFKAAHE